MYSQLELYQSFIFNHIEKYQDDSEQYCEFVSSRGLAKSCKKYQSPLVSSTSYINPILFDNLNYGDSVYICTAALSNFVNMFLDKLNIPIVLVSGDSDDSIGNDTNIPFKNMTKPISNDIINSILNSPFILKWFPQNCLMTHDKIVSLPIGLDYHSMTTDYNSSIKQEYNIKEIIQIPLYKRKPMIYSNMHFNLHRGDRQEAYDKINKNIIYYELTQVDRYESFKKQIEYAFVLSPYGMGPDCHRTWEALVLGCIPIIHSSNMDPLFNDLPVLLVNDWADLTLELLKQTLQKFSTTTFNKEKFTLKYYVNQINYIH
jgi:hypothetical protein